MSDLSRRKFIATASAAATGVIFANKAAAESGLHFSSPIYVAEAEKPETTTVKLGFIALTDSAPILIAEEKGLFAKYGMKDVQVIKQTSWAAYRDNVELGSSKGGIDGGHLLTPIPYLLTMGAITKGSQPVPMNILARLNLNGQGITISNVYSGLKLDKNAGKFKPEVEKAKKAGNKLELAMTFPGGTHDLWLRYWLAAGGIEPDKDVNLIVIPPPQMVANLETKAMSAYCVGEPWNDRAISKKIGYSAITTGELWKDHPEKAFALRADWVSKNPKAAKALTMAIQEAQMWCDNPANKEEMCKILSKDQYVKAPVADILERIKGTFDMGNGRVLSNSPLVMKFWQNNASYPFKSHDLWFLTEEIRWGKIPANTNAQKLISQVNRDDIWKAAATAIGQKAAIPKSSSRGVETFFDGVKFDPNNPSAYLSSLKIKKA